MKTLLPWLLLGCLSFTGCKTAGKSASDDAEIPFREMRTQMIQQMRAAGASSAQIRDMERQLDVMERQMKQMERQMEKLDSANE